MNVLDFTVRSEAESTKIAPPCTEEVQCINKDSSIVRECDCRENEIAPPLPVTDRVSNVQELKLAEEENVEILRVNVHPSYGEVLHSLLGRKEDKDDCRSEIWFLTHSE